MGFERAVEKFLSVEELEGLEIVLCWFGPHSLSEERLDGFLKISCGCVPDRVSLGEKVGLLSNVF